jgi:hypothetical protein
MKPMTPISRRMFLGRCAAASATAILCPTPFCFAGGNNLKNQTVSDWLAMRQDPVRVAFPGKPDLDTILGLFPRTTGQPAFDPELIAQKAKDLRTSPPVNIGHPFLDQCVKIGLAHIDATFQGDHPKYGVGAYANSVHDGFPPTIIAAADALSAWGMNARAAQLFRYWLANFVRDDGTIKYYGPSIAEYGYLLHTAALLQERAGVEGWWMDSFKPLDRIAQHLLELRAAAVKSDGLIAGVPEADTRTWPGKFFHNNAWAAKGLRRWSVLCDRCKASPATAPSATRKIAAQMDTDTLHAIRKTWPSDASAWWLPPQTDPLKTPASLTATRDSSYTNYRYWPELLSSGLLPRRLAGRVVNARLSAGGQFCGMTRFERGLDDWPLADYLYGLWSLGRKDDFLLSLYGHVAYHQAEGHLTAYESVTFPPGTKGSDYCLPSQLVSVRAARLLVK